MNEEDVKERGELHSPTRDWIDIEEAKYEFTSTTESVCL